MVRKLYEQMMNLIFSKLGLALLILFFAIVGLSVFFKALRGG